MVLEQPAVQAQSTWHIVAAEAGDTVRGKPEHQGDPNFQQGHGTKVKVNGFRFSPVRDQCLPTVCVPNRACAKDEVEGKSLGPGASSLEPRAFSFHNQLSPHR